MNRFERLRSILPGGCADFGIRSPLRICPIGAHVDHQGGLVTGMAIDRSVEMAAIATDQRVFRVSSEQFPGAAEVDLGMPCPKPRGDWADYLRAAVSIMQNEAELQRGVHAVISGDLPGTGLSSSAAVLVSFFLAMAEANEIVISPSRLVKLVQKAENTYIGLASGLLDPSIIVFSKMNTLTVIDCSDFDVSNIAADSMPDFEIIVAFSGSTRQLVGTGYNSRVEECRQAAAELLKFEGHRGAPVLREIEYSVFEDFGPHLAAGPRKRATHFFSEMQRVRDGIAAWREGDLEGFGALMTASGESSISNFESGTPDLITMHGLLRDSPGVFGTRFSGAGFGGSCIALVDPQATTSIIDSVRVAYCSAHPLNAERAGFFRCKPAGPAAVLRP